MGGGITGGNSNNISWGLPITNHGVSTNNIIAPLSGQNSNTKLSNEGFHSITTRSIHSEAIIDTSTQKNLPLFDKGYNPILSCKIQINGHDRFSKRDGKYFNIVQPYQHHTNVPSTGINVYSFALYPEDHQPSGTCNFSNIDTSNLLFTLTKESVNLQRKCNIRIYGINYNVLKIDSGMGRLAYSK